jgi:hypothetical protein
MALARVAMLCNRAEFKVGQADVPVLKRWVRICQILFLTTILFCLLRLRCISSVGHWDLTQVICRAPIFTAILFGHGLAKRGTVGLILWAKSPRLSTMPESLQSVGISFLHSLPAD